MILPEILDNFVELYLHIKPKNRTPNTFFGGLRKWVAWSAQVVLGQQTDEKIVEDCNNIMRMFRPAPGSEPNATLGFDDWIEVVFHLGNKALDAQSQKSTNTSSVFKYFTPAESLRCNIYHATRNYLVNQIKECYPQEYANYIERKRIEYSEHKGKRARPKNSNNNMTHEINNADHILIRMAYLEDQDAIIDAVDIGLFDKLVKHYNDNRQRPICLDPNFAKDFYNGVCNDITKIDYSRFTSEKVVYNPTGKPYFKTVSIKAHHLSKKQPQHNESIEPALESDENSEQHSPRYANQ